jgi:hypothetical protein
MIKILLTLLSIAPLCTWAAPVYKHVAPDGRISYSDVPASTGSAAVKGAVRPASSAPPAGPVAAATAVATTEVVVDAVYAFCRVEVPESAPGIMAARERWKIEHAPLRAKSEAILGDTLSPQERQRIAIMLKQENDKITGQLRQALPAERKRMCDGAPGRLAAPEMQLVRQPALVRAIMEYATGR